jgi:hypothetical protein
MFALSRHRTRRVTAAATGRLVVSAVAVETAYALAVAAAVPHGVFAVGIIIAMAWLLVMLIQTRID